MANPKRKILLINYKAGASLHGIGNDDSAMTLAPHILKSHLLRNGRQDIEIFIMALDQRECQETTLRNIHALKPHIVGFSCFVWNFERVTSLSKKLKLILPNTEVVFGGPEVSDKGFSVETINRYPWIDAVFRGEAESTLEMYLDERTCRGDIEGLTHREHGLIVANDGLPRFPIPEETPSVYTPEFVKHFPIVYYATSRGCVGRCHYCQEWSIKRNLSLARVEKDLGVIFKYGRMKMFHFIDSVMDDNLERLNHILDMTARLNKNAVPIGAYFYFQNATPELFKKLKQAHFKSLRIGVESHNKDSLRRTGRSSENLSRIDNALPYKRFFNIVPYVITHLPGETPESFRSNIREYFSKGLFQLDFHCNRLSIYPGTHLYRHAQEEGYVFDECPPHHVFSSIGWSYARFVEDKMFMRNVTVLGKLFSPIDELFLSQNNISVFKMADTIHKIVPEWKSSYSHMSSDSISDLIINDEMPELFLKYATKLRMAECSREVLIRFFLLKYYIYKAKNVASEYYRQRSFSEEITLDSSFFIPFYAFLPAGPDFSIVESEPEILFKNLPSSPHGVFVVGSFPVGEERIISDFGQKDVELFLSLLKNNLKERKKLSDILKSLRCDQWEPFMGLTRHLQALRSLLSESEDAHIERGRMKSQ